MDSPAHRVSCGLLVRDGRVFLVHRADSNDWYPNVWDFPGGHIEPGESSPDALMRELREELGVTVVPLGDAPLMTLRDEGVVMDIWRIHEWEGEVVNAAPEEHDALGWFTLGEAKSLNLADPEYRALLDQILG